MSVQKCYISWCPQRAEILCKCTSNEIFMCKNHINEHTSTFFGWNHNFIQIEASQKQNKAIIDVLTDIKQQIMKVRKESIEIFSKCISSFESLIDYSLQNTDFIINQIDQRIHALANIDINSKIYDLFEEELSRNIESLLDDNENKKIVNSINKFMKEIIKITENVAKRPSSAIKEFLGKFEEKSIDEELKKHENFIKSWAEDFRDFPSRSPFWHCKKGIFEYYSGNAIQALNDINFAIFIKPGYLDAIWYKSIILANLNRKEEAITCLNELIDSNPQFSIVHLIKAEFLFSINLKKESLDCYNKPCSFPEKFFMNYFKYKCLLDLQKYNEIINCCNELIQEYPKFSLSYSQKGSACQELKQYDDASNCYSEAIITDSNCYQAFNGLGKLYFAEKNGEEAIKYFNEAIKVNPYYSWGYSNKGAVLLSLNKRKEAMEAWNLAIKFDQNNHFAYNNIGNYFFKEQRLDDAIKNYNEAIRSKPNYISAYINKGVTLKKKGEYDDAIECYTNIIRIDPNYDSAYYNIGCILLDKKQYEESIKYFNDAISIKPENEMYHQTLADALDEISKEKKAMESYNKGIEIKNN